MVVIRLARGGAKKRPFFNLVVADSRRARDGRFIERLGFYNPKAPAGQESLRINRERLAHWQSQGAILSATAARLVKQMGAQRLLAGRCFRVVETQALDEAAVARATGISNDEIEKRPLFSAATS